MSTPFLERFSYHVVRALVAQGQLEVAPGREHAVVQHVAAALARVHQGSLISSLAAALVSCPDVEELFADDARLIELVGDLDPSIVRG